MSDEVKINKRKKSSTFSKEDEIKLLYAIYSERKIIENKETNKFTNIEKDKAWGRVGILYNADAVEFRNVDQLKSKFVNLKTKSRKTVAQQRAHIKGTGGGGPLYTDEDPVIQLVLKIINWKTVVGLENIFDSDNIDEEGREIVVVDGKQYDNKVPMLLDFDNGNQSNMPNTINNENNKIIVLATEQIATCSSESPVSRQQTPPKEARDNGQYYEIEEEMPAKVKKQIPKTQKHVWDNYTTKNLKEPVTRKLRQAIVSPLGLAKELYYKNKAMLVEEEIRLRKNQDKREEEHHQMRKTLLELDIQLKKEELKKIKSHSSTD